ncbi:5'-nucleotidase C-terminal domain-containing protein [Neobacillus sp. 3P2-tot-E-2]|uniref:5'-nucleotidase C-terminal domain-containing protein n=1 Tax=Neobacillus sp. 3P2-tot-E-2 TaxID=3132212 RepID=UPI0039A09E3A
MKKRHKKSLSIVTVPVLLMGLLSPVAGTNAKAEIVKATDLIISEYIEGSSFNKAIELYNGTGADVDLSQYTLGIHTNGAEAVSKSLGLSGTLENGKTYVLYNNQAAEGIKSKGNLVDSTVINFNGNDPIVLKKGGTIIDSIGQVGTTVNWAVDGTFVRKSNVLTGDTNLKDEFNNNQEWTRSNIDDFTNLGTHFLGSVTPEEPNEPAPIPAISIEKARQAVGETVTIEGIATTKSGLWGSETFYMQDETAGMYVFSSPQSVKPGDKVKITGDLVLYKGELEIKPTSLVIISSGNQLPAAQSVKAVDKTTQGELLKLERVTITEMTKDSYGTATFQAKFESGETVRVIHDNRTGSNYDELVKHYKEGDLVHIVGLGSVDDNGFNLKTTGLDSYDLVNKPAVYVSQAQGVVPADTKIVLNSGLEGAEIHYTTDGSTPTAASAKYVAPIELKTGETTIKAIAVKGETVSEVFSFTYKILNTEGVKIHDIQGKGHVSEYNGASVKAVTGVVTHKFSNNSFVMQDITTADNDKATSEAIEVSKTAHGVIVGDTVTVDGTVTENGGGANLSTTRITATAVTKTGTAELPEPLVVGKDILPPNKIIDNDKMQSYDPAEDGIDFWESVEYMRVSFPSPVVVGPPYSNDIPIMVPSTSNNTLNVAGGINIAKDDYNPEKIMLDNVGNDYRSGDKFDGNVIGIVSYASTGYQVVTNKTTLPSVIPSTFKAEVTNIEREDEKLIVASYNVENFSNNTANTPDAKVAKIAKTFVENMKSPDIITLIEVQDNDGETDSGNVDATQSYERLIKAIKDAGGPTYNWTDVAPVNNTNGGAPGGNIRVGYLYNPERVKLVEGTHGTSTQANGWTEKGNLTLNPGVVNPEKFAGTRKPIAAEFEFKGERVVVIGAHLNSKGGDESLWGSSQPPKLGSETQRLGLAQEINNFIKAGLAKNPALNVVVAGDMNDFEFTPVLAKLKGNELTNMVDLVPEKDRFSYFFQGNNQVLDHVLVTKNLVPNAIVDMVHINANFTEEQGQASDHDPVVVQLGFDFPDLSIIHTNDTHAALENMPRTVTALKDMRATYPGSLLLHAGDAFTGTLFFNEFQGKADLDIMNLMKFDAMTFGNHEFDLGSSAQGHQKLADFIKGAQFPFVSANVDFSNDEKFEDIFTDLYAANVENGQIYNGIIKEVNGEKVGIFGLTTEETADISSPGSIEFENYLTEAKKAVKALEAQGVKRIVALTHIGYDDNPTIDNDLILAEKVEGIDVIVGGHTHTALTKPTLIEKDATPTVIVQTGNSNSNLGVLNVDFDDKGVVKAYNGRLIAIDTKIAADPEAVKVLEPYQTQVTKVSKTEIGVSTPIALESPRTNGDNTKPSVRKNETILGNLITDGMLKKAKSFTGKNVIMALQNGGGIRAGINQGPITVGEVITVLPFNNTLATMDVTGAELKAAFEISLSQYPAENGGFLHVAGGKVVYDMTKPAKQRIVSVSYLNETGKYVEVQDDVKYTIATNAFTAKGGDGYDVFAKAYAEGRVTDLGLSDWENFRDHLVSIGSEGIPTKVEGRILDVTQVVPSENPGENPGQNPGEVPGNTDGTTEIKVPVTKIGNKYTISEKALENLKDKAVVVFEVDNKTNATLALTKAQVQALKSANAVIVVSNGNVDVQIPASMLPLAENLDISVKKMEAKGALAVYDFKIEVDGKEYHKFNEKVKLTFKVDPKQVKNPKDVKIYYWNEEKKNWELIGGEYNNGEVSAYTDHFSTFGVFEGTPDSIETPTKGNHELPNTATNNYNNLLAGLMLVIAGSVLFFVKRRNTTLK